MSNGTPNEALNYLALRYPRYNWTFDHAASGVWLRCRNGAMVATAVLITAQELSIGALEKAAEQQVQQLGVARRLMG